MRYHCWTCGKSVTSELPDETVIRAILTCPECIEKKKVTIPDDLVDGGQPDLEKNDTIKHVR